MHRDADDDAPPHISPWRELLANIVRVIHICIIAFLVYAPFSSCPPIWVLGTMSLAFIMSHWCMPGPAQDTCALTIAERVLRGCSKDESFFNSIISPVYRFVNPEGVCSDALVRKSVWVASFVLLAIGSARIVANWAEVKRSFGMRGSTQKAVQTQEAVHTRTFLRSE